MMETASTSWQVISLRKVTATTSNNISRFNHYLVPVFYMCTLSTPWDSHRPLAVRCCRWQSAELDRTR